MNKEYDGKDVFIIADSKNDSVEKLSLLTKENFEINKIAPIQNNLNLGNSGRGTEFVIGKNGGIKNESINIRKIEKGNFRN